MKLRQTLSISLIILSVCQLCEAKPPLDHLSYRNWNIVGDNPKISATGEYVAYSVLEPESSGSRKEVLFLQGADNTWKKEIYDSSSSDTAFSADGHYAIFIKAGGILGIATLGTDHIAYVPQVEAYELHGYSAGEWLSYKLAGDSQLLILTNLATGRSRQYSDVSSYVFSPQGGALLLNIENKNEGLTTHSLVWTDPVSGAKSTIWSGQEVSHFSFDPSGTQLAFIATDEDNGQKRKSLWHFSQGKARAEELIGAGTVGMERGAAVADEDLKFSTDGERIFFSTVRNDTPSLVSGAGRLDVWSYKDPRLQSEQLYSPTNDIHNEAAISTRDEHIIALTRTDYQTKESVQSHTDGFALVTSRGDADDSEWFWNPAARESLYLISTKDGSRKRLIDQSAEPQIHCGLSPGSQYAYYFDSTVHRYMIHEIATGLTRPINAPMPMSWDWTLGEMEGPEGNHFSQSSVVGWADGDSFLLMQDGYDIWKVDPRGTMPAVNITRGFGRRNHISFQLLEEKPIYPAAEPLQPLLISFDNVTKDEGFYRVSEQGDPIPLTTGPYVYAWQTHDAFRPVKAANASRFIVRRASVTGAPNYYVTEDFSDLRPLTHIEPQERFNWMTRELVQWKTFDGSRSNGILYRPEDFDAKKKYPVVFLFYERMSDGLNEYPAPYPSGDVESIAWLVSNGYLVFKPDIHYTFGDVGKSVYNSVVSAAKYLAGMSWVDGTKIGIQGFSFGGYEVNYLVSRTNLFAAAFSGCGASDVVSLYGSVTKVDGAPEQFITEVSQFRIGATLWEHPNYYTNSSPVFRADKVSTPLLMMSNKADLWNLYPQGVEYFTDLRRLGKRVWMLQYDHGGHGVGGEDALDLDQRVGEFFDYYLKGTPPPQWMTQGIPARLKGIETGLALDLSGAKPWASWRTVR